MGTVTHEDIAQALQKALAAAQGSSDGAIDYSYGLTIPELARHLDVSDTFIRRRIRRAIDAGIVECNGRRLRRTMSGERCRVPVYRVKKNE